MNKSIWLEMAITTTKRQSKKQVQSNVRRLREAEFFRGHSGGLSILRRFLFLFLIFWGFFVTFLSTSCFLRWETVPTLFELSDPSFLFPCSPPFFFFKTPSTTWWSATYFSQTCPLNCFFLCQTKHSVQTIYASKYCICSYYSHTETKRQFIGQKKDSGSSETMMLPSCLLSDKRQLSQFGPEVRIRPCC